MPYENAPDILDEKDWIQKYTYRIISYMLQWKKKDSKEVWQKVVAQGRKVWVFFLTAF